MVTVLTVFYVPVMNVTVLTLTKGPTLDIVTGAIVIFAATEPNFHCIFSEKKLSIPLVLYNWEKRGVFSP